ncbi:acyl-CoA synthetase [Nocardioides humilatus]|uniref:Acyl-CoA synthetase n=1 Tax=Nocardioides humilatus TaxID=2607660 RepID=A0A5B1L8K0_9ACTN|nr:acyl-CoA synthetase [Nocardioides humilatus]KAA1416952.1 acyl-CoA synthetase [Nocardioides humilatus]
MYPGTTAALEPDKPAVIMSGSGRSLTYGELEDRSARLARALHDLGLRTGDVVALITDNTPEALEVYWAALRSGLYLTTVNHHLTPGEAAYIVNDSGARVVIASAELEGLAVGVAGQTTEVTHRICFGGTVEGHASYEEVLAGAGEPLAAMPRGGEMLYSSGTTGSPKGVRPPLLPLQVDEPGEPFTAIAPMAFGFGTDTVYLSTAPIYHAAPLRFCGVVHAHGGTVVMMEKFDAEGLLRAVQDHAVTHLQVVPTMFVRILQLPDDARTGFDMSSLRMAIHAAAPCPPDVKEAMIALWGPILLEYYGSTEGNGFAFITTEEWLRKRGSVGTSKLGPVHICDDEGEVLPVGEVGTIYFERDRVMFEYHNDPAKTAASRHPRHELWSAVGDLGYVDEDGYLFLTDRKAFVIISGGVNIYPQEIENVLTLHPAVYDVAVIGVPDPVFGEQVKAVVQLRAGHVGSPELAADITAYVHDRLASFKVPRSVDFVDSLPRSATGKLVKGELMKIYLERV